MADEPWLKYQTSPTPAPAAADAGPWTKYAAPPKQNPGADISRGQQPDEGHSPFQDIGDMVTHGISSAGQSLQSLGQGVEGLYMHPLDTGANIMSGVGNAASRVGSAVMHPIDTAGKIGDTLKNLTGAQAGEALGPALIGGGVGRAAGAVGDMAGASMKALQKPVSPTIRDLASKGVVMTPGQRGGRLASAIEQRLTSVSIAGDSIKAARGKATEQWNRAEINDAIKDAGGKPLPEQRTGRDAIFHAENEMSSAYGRVLPKMQGSLTSADASGVTFRQQIADRVGQNRKLDRKHSKLLQTIIDDDVVAKFGQSGGYTRGDTVKEIQETLRVEAEALGQGTYQDRQAATVVNQIRTDFMDMLKRENPKIAPELEKVDRGFAKFKTASKASQYSTKQEGGFTPAQKLRAIRARDKSKDKQRFASGTAPGQKATEEAEKILGNTEPDSGTPGRLLSVEALLHPAKAAALAATSPLYSQTVLKALQNRALKKGLPSNPGRPWKAPIAGAALMPGQVDENGIAQ